MAIRKRSWTTAKAEQREAWIVEYVDQAGKRRLKTFKRKKDADSFQTTAKFEVGQGTHTADSQSKTIGEAADLWLSACVQNGLEASTIAQYTQHVDLHIKPYLGNTKLSQLTSPMVREFEGKLRDGTPPTGADTVAARSVAMTRKIVTSLGTLIGDAQECGLVARNVVRDLHSRRKRGKKRQADRRRTGKLKVGVDIPTREEIRAIVDALPADGRWRPLLLMVIFTGLRASELRGLRWADVDFRKNELHVHQRADRYNQIGPPKSEAGERTVPIPSVALTALREWRPVCPKSDGDLVFPTASGKVIAHKYIVQHGLGPLVVAAGVTTVGKDIEGNAILLPKYSGLHAFRHFYASWAINRKVDGGLELPPKVVQERLGHSSITITLDVYGHLFPRGDDSAEMAAAELSLLG